MFCTRSGKAHVQEAVGPERERLWRAVIGLHHTEAYLDTFLAFERAGRTWARWHWPAFWATLCWLLYRRLWWAAVGYLLLILLALLGAGFVAGFVVALTGTDPGWVLPLTIGLSAALLFVWPARWAHAVLYAHYRRHLDPSVRPFMDMDSRVAHLAELGGTRAAPAAVAAVAGLVVLAFVLAQA